VCVCADGAGAGAGAGGAEAAGAGGAGSGGLGNAGKVSAGIPDHSSKGFLTTHRSHCSKTLISATAPQQPPLESNVN
jgi:hypothetical protein